ncbi:MAG: hypothetical protein HWE10_08160 [Gammaproteobacteria bacterium]|nr:hypothetical protein [Gammaproteobacteria bacterium]
MKPIINLVLLGRGNVGATWLNLFPEQQARYAAFADVQLIAVANSARFMFDTSGIRLAQASEFNQLSNAGNLAQLIQKISEQKLTNVVVLDLTASQQVADSYTEFAELGWNIVSANKRPVTASVERYKLLVQKLRSNHCYWGINATVGAALPIQTSLQELVYAGDKVMSVAGVFSGSLSYLLTKYDGKESFTDLIKQACDAGITEPDPRDDLSGTDVQRKLLILSRIAGYIINLDDISVQPLLPDSLLEGTLADFWNRKEAIDEFMAEAFNKAKSQNARLVYCAKTRFVGKVAEGRVSLESLAETNAMSQLTPSDNVFELVTDYYQSNPLIIRGPGAGAEVTAAAVNIDLNKFITQLSASAERL